MKKTNCILQLVIISSLLTGCCQDRVDYERILDQAEKQNADYDSITNLDSIKLAVSFMDAHGSHNERIRAHYLLGCAYRDMGEAPLALDSYQNATNCADTTALDCDYKYLMKVHSQMVALFYQQMLPFEMLHELDLQYKYALMSDNKYSEINAIERKAGAYELLNMTDSVIKIREMVYQMYKQNGLDKESGLSLGPIITKLVEKGCIEKAKLYMDIYERAIGWGNNDIIEKHKKTHYYAKGRYYLAKAQTDSAKYSFYKLLDPALDDDQHEAGYRGLYLLYKSIGQKDSLAKYADLGYQLNDASYASKATKDMQQMQALYNYTRSQKEASEMKDRADRNILLFMGAVVILILVLAIGGIIYQKRRKEAQILYLHYENAKSNLEKAKREQIKMEEENSSLLEEKNHEILMYEQQIRDYETKLKIERKKVTNEELMSTPIYQLFKNAISHPKEKITKKDWQALRKMIDEKIPCFYSEIHASRARLQQQDYDICILIRLYFTPSEISALTNNSASNISMKRIRLLKRIFSVDGSPEEFDKRIHSIS